MLSFKMNVTAAYNHVWKGEGVQDDTGYVI